jgi:heme/copper-type cytochrome/quinol oxidase subunit 1
MIWDILLGFFVAIILLVIVSAVFTGMTNYYQKLLEHRLQEKLARADLIPILARFAAVITIILMLALVLSLRMGALG